MFVFSFGPRALTSLLVAKLQNAGFFGSFCDFVSPFSPIIAIPMVFSSFFSSFFSLFFFFYSRTHGPQVWPGLVLLFFYFSCVLPASALKPVCSPLLDFSPHTVSPLFLLGTFSFMFRSRGCPLICLNVPSVTIFGPMGH